MKGNMKNNFEDLDARFDQMQQDWDEQETKANAEAELRRINRNQAIEDWAWFGFSILVFCLALAIAWWVGSTVTDLIERGY